MAVLDTAGPPTAIHAFAFESRSCRETQPTLLGIKMRYQENDAMPGSLYKIDPVADLPYAEEFFANPVGHQSPGLQRVLHVFRGEPLQNKYVLVTTQPHAQWQLARLSGERGKPLTLLDTFYTCLLTAERDIFKRRWKDFTGEDLPFVANKEQP
jgi:hypothetical protein